MTQPSARLSPPWVHETVCGPSCTTGPLLLPSVETRSGGLGVGLRPVGCNGPAQHARTSLGFACGQNTAGVSKQPILTRHWMAAAVTCSEKSR